MIDDRWDAHATRLVFRTCCSRRIGDVGEVEVERIPGWGFLLSHKEIGGTLGGV